MTLHYDALHPYPRYGAAAALVRARRAPDDVTTAEALAPLVADALEEALATYSLHTPDDPKAEGATLTFHWVADPAPGKETGQIAARGYYLAPHVTTSDGSAAGLIAEARSFVQRLRGGEALDRPTDLLRSYAPLVTKVNSGSPSLSNPRAPLIEGALTALTTVTSLKAATWSLGNAALIPDLPMHGPNGSHPLVDYVWFFSLMSAERYDLPAALQTTPKADGGYRRPPLFDGNFPEAPHGGALGSLAVAASVGWWARHGGARRPDDAEAWAKRVLSLLAERPLLVVTQGDTVSSNSRQERFGSHVVRLALDGVLREATVALRRVMPTAATGWSDPKVDLFRLMADRFLRLFTRPALRDFLATRAIYPAVLRAVFDVYFTGHAMPALDPDLVASARAYGAALNHAAFRAAAADAQEDTARRGDNARSRHEYQQRILAEFESAVQSAKNGPQLLAKVGSRVGRLGNVHMPPEAMRFMDAVASGPGEDGLPIEVARDLVTAYMRLDTRASRVPAEPVTNETSPEPEPTAPDEDLPSVPSDVPPVTNPDLFSTDPA